MVEADRVVALNSQAVQPERKWVLYWMQASHRTEDNQALEYAIETAMKLRKSLVVAFLFTPNYHHANQRNLLFMLQGLRDLSQKLEHNSIPFVLWDQSKSDFFEANQNNIACVITDRAYLKGLIRWRKEVAISLDCTMVQVEGNVLVPLETISQKEEYAAATIRPKIRRVFSNFIDKAFVVESRGKNTERRISIFSKLDMNLQAEAMNEILLVKSSDSSFINIRTKTDEELLFFLGKFSVDETVMYLPEWVGGETQALKQMYSYFESGLEYYDTLRNDPEKDFQSKLSPYLHFGQISPKRIVEELFHQEYNKGKAIFDPQNPQHIRLEALSSAAQAFFEELIVRRELAMNFCYFNSDYDSLESMHSWAKKTMNEHTNDPREIVYTREQLEEGRTHDDYWNAAQLELVHLGKMHGYMRMYWAKKVIEWTNSFEEAFDFLAYCNDRYSLDGRDPNGYTGIAWCFGKHDRAWKERPIFGKIRYMNAKGLERKFNIKAYVSRIAASLKSRGVSTSWFPAKSDGSNQLKLL
jgi:deoxyribodipyrimidine photo-lyase